MRAIASSSLSLGLLNAPVKIYNATSDISDIRFKLCDEGGREVEQVYRVKDTDEIVGGKAECHRMFDGRVIDQQNIDAIKDESLKEEVDGEVIDLKASMQIQKFIPLKEVPFERVTGWYYIGPDKKKGNTQAFDTLLAALKKSKRAAVVKYCLRDRQAMFVLYERDGILNAVKVAFSHSINEVNDDVRGEGNAPKAHVEMATQLIDAYTDEKAEILNSMEDTLIERKNALVDKVMQGKKVEPKAVSEKPAHDLMDALTESVEQAKGKKEKVTA